MMAFLLTHLTLLWLLLGTSFIIAEAFLVPGVGFFFAGLGAFSIGGLLAFGILSTSDFFLQLGYVSLATLGWTLLLWKPFKRYISSRHDREYSNLVGEEATVASLTLEKRKKGHIYYSGTTMSALLDERSIVDQLPQGATVYITHISGTTASVMPTPLTP